MLRVGIPERIKGYKAVEIVGSNFDLFYTSEDREAGAQKRRSGLQLETALRRKGVACAQGWDKIWANVVIHPIRNDAGGLAGF